MPALGTYRGLLTATSPGFLVLCFLARFPTAMGALGVLTLVASTTGSFAAAGLAAGALGLAAAIGGPVIGTLADRFGQRPVGFLAALIDAFAYAAVLIATLQHAPVAVIGGVAAVAGFVNPQVGPLVRARWSTLLGDRGEQRLLPTAMSYEGAADEASYVLGPALVGLLALTGYPGVPLITVITLLLLATTSFALHPTAPPNLRVPGRYRRERLPLDLVGLIVSMACLGLVFGATQTGVSALAVTLGWSSGAGGLMYAVMGLGSVLAGLLTAVLPARFRLADRYVVFAAAVALVGAALPALSSPVPVMVVLAVLGAVVAPYLITVYALAERIAPPGRTGTAMTLVTSGLVAGSSGGVALAGWLAEAYGYSWAFTLPVVAGVLAVGLTLATRGRLSRLRAPNVVPESVFLSRTGA